MANSIARLAFTAGMIFMFAGMVQAEEGMHHGGMHMDEEMARQHRMMGMYALTQAKIAGALDKGDAATVATETRKLLASIPDLKKAKPHKNQKDRKTYTKIASAFEGDIKTTAVLAKKGNFPGAKTAFAKAQKRCDECHAKFRD